MQKPATSKLRADAEMNRSRILEAAREALAESGDASMFSIAKRAGIGQGTLYRHFPTRESLVLEVHRRDVAALVAAAPALLNDLDPDLALRSWLDQLADYGRIKRGLASAFQSATHSQRASEGYQPVVDAIAILLDAGKSAGKIRPDIEASDLLLLVGFLWRVEADDQGVARADHLLALVMDAVRPQL